MTEQDSLTARKLAYKIHDTCKGNSLEVINYAIDIYKDNLEGLSIVPSDSLLYLPDPLHYRFSEEDDKK